MEPRTTKSAPKSFIKYISSGVKGSCGTGDVGAAAITVDTGVVETGVPCAAGVAGGGAEPVVAVAGKRARERVGEREL